MTDFRAAIAQAGATEPHVKYVRASRWAQPRKRCTMLFMARPALPQHKGLLSPLEVAKGMNAATRNAQRLHQDAVTMLAGKRYPTAFALAALAIEEHGKLQILRRIACCTKEADAFKLWKDYRSHTAKSRGWVAMDVARESIRDAGMMTLEDFGFLFTDNTTHPAILEQLKQLAFYTDALHNQVWSIPEQQITEDLAQNVVRVAGELIGIGKLVSEREIELWRDHVGQVGTYDGLISWYAAMQAEGLAPPGPNAMEVFIRQGLTARNQPHH